MGLESYKSDKKNDESSAKPSACGKSGETINSLEQAKDAIKKSKDVLGKSPTVKEFNSVRDKINYSTSGHHFKRQTGLTFNEVKKEVNMDVHDRGIIIQEKDSLYEKTEELGYIIGVLLGDGGVYENDDSRWVSLQSKDKEFVERFGKVFCLWSGLEWHGFKDEKTQVSCYGPIYINDSTEDNWKVLKGVTNIFDFLKEYQDGQYNQEDIIDSSLEFRVGLIRGLWDSEGSISTKHKRVSFSNTDEKIIQLYSQLVSDIIGDVRVSRSKECTNVRLIKEYNKEFYYTIDPTIKRKRELFEEDIDKQ